jgi:hypothetical protein
MEDAMWVLNGLAFTVIVALFLSMVAYPPPPKYRR